MDHPHLAAIKFVRRNCSGILNNYAQFTLMVIVKTVIAKLNKMSRS